MNNNVHNINNINNINDINNIKKDFRIMIELGKRFGPKQVNEIIESSNYDKLSYEQTESLKRFTKYFSFNNFFNEYLLFKQNQQGGIRRGRGLRKSRLSELSKKLSPALKKTVQQIRESDITKQLRDIALQTLTDTASQTLTGLLDPQTTQSTSGLTYDTKTQEMDAQEAPEATQSASALQSALASLISDEPKTAKGTLTQAAFRTLTDPSLLKVLGSTIGTTVLGKEKEQKLEQLLGSQTGQNVGRDVSQAVLDVLSGTKQPSEVVSALSPTLTKAASKVSKVGALQLAEQAKKLGLDLSGIDLSTLCPEKQTIQINVKKSDCELYCAFCNNSMLCPQQANSQFAECAKMCGVCNHKFCKN